MCLFGKSVLLCIQCRGFGLHLPPRGMSHGISRVVAGTWGIFSSYSGDGHSKLHFVQRSQDSCLVRTDTSGIKTRFGRIIQTLFGGEVGDQVSLSSFYRDIGIPINIQGESGLRTF